MTILLNVVDNYILIIAFISVLFIGLVVLYLCYKFGPLKGKLFSLKNVVIGHGIAIFVIIGLLTILFILWVLEDISGMQ